MGAYNYRNGFKVTLQPQMLDRPMQWRRPQRIFVNSMSDLFHVEVPKDYIHRVFDVMVRAHWHQFQVLTKRSGRFFKLSKELPWPGNVWMGVSVESSDYVRRIDHLRGTGARVRFLSLEPLIGPLPNLDLRAIDWVIVGGESGPGSRPMDPAWVREIRDQCIDAEVAFFFKQWGGVFKKRAGRKLDDRAWDQYPASALA
jgi:protein gp37